MGIAYWFRLLRARYSWPDGRWTQDRAWTIELCGNTYIWRVRGPRCVMDGELTANCICSYTTTARLNHPVLDHARKPLLFEIVCCTRSHLQVVSTNGTMQRLPYLCHINARNPLPPFPSVQPRPRRSCPCVKKPTARGLCVHTCCAQGPLLLG